MLPGGTESYWLATTAQLGKPNCREREAMPHQQNTSQHPIQEVPSARTKKISGGVEPPHPLGVLQLNCMLHTPDQHSVPAAPIKESIIKVVSWTWKKPYQLQEAPPAQTTAPTKKSDHGSVVREKNQPTPKTLTGWNSTCNATKRQLLLADLVATVPAMLLPSNQSSA